MCLQGPWLGRRRERRWRHQSSRRAPASSSCTSRRQSPHTATTRSSRPNCRPSAPTPSTRTTQAAPSSLAYDISCSFYAGLSPTYLMCSPCLADAFSRSGDQLCTPCPAGTKQPGSVQLLRLRQGICHYSPGHSLLPVRPVRPRHLRVGPAHRLRPVRLGHLRGQAATACLVCLANTYSQQDRSTCVPCP